MFIIILILFCDRNLWEKLEEIPPDSWDEFSDLFSRAPVAAKPVKAKTEKTAKQQTVKSNINFYTCQLSALI